MVCEHAALYIRSDNDFLRKKTKLWKTHLVNRDMMSIFIHRYLSDAFVQRGGTDVIKSVNILTEK